MSRKRLPNRQVSSYGEKHNFIKEIQMSECDLRGVIGRIIDQNHQEIPLEFKLWICEDMRVSEIAKVLDIYQEDLVKELETFIDKIGEWIGQELRKVWQNRLEREIRKHSEQS